MATTPRAPVWKVFARVFLFGFIPAMSLAILSLFPYDTDPSVGKARSTGVEKSAQNFYDTVYGDTPAAAKTAYVEVDKQAAEDLGVKNTVGGFVRQYHLEDKKVLEIGSGAGLLQDLVADYTGLDVSPSLGQRYHKKFVVGSATELPFADNSFDAIWTVWVMEHIPEPERALSEIRRVLKPGGILFMVAAWNCDPFRAKGYVVRPYSDFGLYDKFLKLTIPARMIARYYTLVPIRLVRDLQYKLQGASTRLHFTVLQPNYKDYWVPDGDAAISLDSYEAALWYRSRGDDCLSCKSALSDAGEVIVRVAKSGQAVRTASR
jgi:SAM-dependent methyltransferase